MRVAISVCGILAVCACSLAAEGPAATPPASAAFLAQSLANWSTQLPVKAFDKDTIFNHIDGEAEIFYPYGFQNAVTANYTHEDVPGVKIQSDIYELGSPLDAFGIYSNYRGAGAEIIDIGCEGYISTSQLVFYQDRFLVKLTASGKSDQLRDHLRAIGAAIQIQMPSPPACPSELALVQVEDVIPKTETYIADSVLGYGFFPKGFVAKAKLHDTDGRVFLVVLPSEEEAKSALAAYRTFLNEKGHALTTISTEAFSYDQATDPLYKGVVFTQTGNYVLGVIELQESAVAIPILKRLHDHVAAQ